jgi:hypothetical protein
VWANDIRFAVKANRPGIAPRWALHTFRIRNQTNVVRTRDEIVSRDPKFGNVTLFQSSLWSHVYDVNRSTEYRTTLKEFMPREVRAGRAKAGVLLADGSIVAVEPDVQYDFLDFACENLCTRDSDCPAGMRCYSVESAG